MAGNEGISPADGEAFGSGLALFVKSTKKVAAPEGTATLV